jgi:mono/diheme cytochrome c family protein
MSEEQSQDIRRRLEGPAIAVIAAVAVVDFAAILSNVGPPTRTAVVVVATLGVLVAAFRLASAERVTAKAVIGHVVAVAGLALGFGGILAALPGRTVRPAAVALATGIIAVVAFPTASLVLLRRLVRTIPVRLGDVLTGLVVAVSVSVVLGGVIGAWASPRRAAVPVAATGAPDPWALGQKVYAGRCAACHGPRGEGGVGPKLRSGETKLTFPNEADHLKWVTEGSVSVAGRYYGDPNRPGGQQGPAVGGMPGFGTLLTEEEIKAVVAFERERL